MKTETIQKAKAAFDKIAAIAEKLGVERSAAISVLKEVLVDAPDMRIVYVPEDINCPVERYAKAIYHEGYVIQFIDEDEFRKTGRNDVRTLPLLGIDNIPEENDVAVTLLSYDEDEGPIAVNIDQVVNTEVLLDFIVQMAPRQDYRKF